jgi:hypothetical protein
LVGIVDGGIGTDVEVGFAGEFEWDLNLEGKFIIGS